MNVRNAFIAVLAISIIGYSCTKTGSNSPASLVGKLKTMTQEANSTNYHSKQTFTFTYDTAGRLFNMIAANTSGFYYQYINNSFFYMDIKDSTGKITIHTATHLNANSLPDSSFQNNNTKDSSYDIYVYDSNNKRIQDRRYNYSSKGSSIQNFTDNIIQNGNVIKEVLTNVSDGSTTTTNYTYYNTANIPISPLPGSSSISTNNLLKSYIETYSYKASADTVDLTYTFDSNNLISTKTQTLNSGRDGIVVETYTYY